MLVRIHNVPMEPRDGSEAEGEEDQFNMVLGALGRTGHPGVTPEPPRGAPPHPSSVEGTLCLGAGVWAGAALWVSRRS